MHSLCGSPVGYSLTGLFVSDSYQVAIKMLPKAVVLSEAQVGKNLLLSSLVVASMGYLYHSAKKFLATCWLKSAVLASCHMADGLSSLPCRLPQHCHLFHQSKGKRLLIRQMLQFHVALLCTSNRIHPITFAVFCCSEASHSSHSHSRGGITQRPARQEADIMGPS